MTTYIIIGAVAAAVILLCAGLAVATFSTDNYRRVLEKTRGFRNTYGFTTREFVDEINKNHYNSKLRIIKAAEYNDHYGSGAVALSESTMESNSLASIATVAHELGHAKQDFEGETLNRLFVLRRIVRVLGLFFMPSLLAGVVLSLLYVFQALPEQLYLILGLGLIGLGVLIFLCALVLKYLEIRVEKEASENAIAYLREYLTEPEIEICEEFLDSARLTYWADFFKALLSWTLLTSRNKMFR